MKSTRLIALFFSGAMMFSGLPAQAEGDPVAQARMLFDAGAKAYEVGNYPAAIQAFDQAYRLAQRPGILFSMAQAHRRQYFIDKNPKHVKAAIKHYRAYVSKVSEGGRRGEAAQALAELEPILERIGEEASETADIPQQTRIMVSTPIKGAMIALDGQKPVADWLSVEVKPGKHKVQVSADGYFPEEREVQAVEGVVIPMEVSLREKPATLALHAPSGAQVSIDGRFTATTPLLRPVEVPTGRHLITVTKNGYRPYVEEIDFERGKSKPLDIKLSSTGQRTASYVLMGGGGVLAVGGVLLALAAAGKNQEATQILNDSTTDGNLGANRLNEYNAAVQARTDLRSGAIVALGAGFAAGSLGALLYLFDQPEVRAPAPSKEAAPTPMTPAPVNDKSLEMSAVPMITPGFYGGSFSARF